MSINRVAISGNLTRDAELRQTQSGTQTLSLGVAVNDRRRNPQTGEWEDVPNFIDCVIFGNRAGALAGYLAKGARVAVEGRLRWHQWQDQQTGQRRSKVEVVVEEVEFLSARQQAPQAYAQQAPQATYARQAPRAQPAPSVQRPYAQQAPQVYTPPRQAPQAPAADVYDEDIPF